MWIVRLPKVRRRRLRRQSMVRSTCNFSLPTLCNKLPARALFSFLMLSLFLRARLESAFEKGAEMASVLETAARILLLVLAIMWAAPSTAIAQWDPYPWKNMPRTPDGKVDLNAPPRKTADGKIDLSGFWMPADNVR